MPRGDIGGDFVNGLPYVVGGLHVGRDRVDNLWQRERELPSKVGLHGNQGSNGGSQRPPHDREHRGDLALMMERI